MNFISPQHQQQQQQQPNQATITTMNCLSQESIIYSSDKKNLSKRCRDGSDRSHGTAIASPTIQSQQFVQHSPCTFGIPPSTLPCPNAVVAAGLPVTPVNVALSIPNTITIAVPSQDDCSVQAYSSATKRTRPNTYISPREVAKTFNNQVGSIAAVFQVNCQEQYQQQPNTTGCIRRNIRRQLSGSKIESFLSGSSGENNDSMDVEDSSRPRRMSF
jgi:hypothetical protein